MAKKMLVLFIIGSAFASCVLAKNEPTKTDEVDPKKSLENLAMFFKMMSSGENGTCTISCPGGSVPSPRPGHVPSSNGCGSMGIKLDTGFFPGFTPCCDKHDKCYDTCNSDRDKCDEEFKACLNDVCEKVKVTRSSQQVTMCENAGGVMQTAAVGLGCNSFKQAQEKACVCRRNIIGKEDGPEDEDEESEKNNGDIENGEKGDKMTRPTETNDDDFERVDL